MLIFLFLLGLVVGSFLGMLTYRLPRDLPLAGRSFCDTCRKSISWFDNIPVFSYLLLGGRCRNCRKGISWRYPVIEVAMALLFVAMYILAQSIPSGAVGLYKEQWGVLFLPFLLFLGSVLFTILIVDLENFIIPDLLVGLFVLVVFLILLDSPSPTFWQHLFTATISFSFFLLIFLLTSGRGMGFGDVKLSFPLGLLLGWPEALVFAFLAFLTGGIAGAILILTGKAKLKNPVPFGPFMVIGAMLGFFFGSQLFQWYLTLP